MANYSDVCVGDVLYFTEVHDKCGTVEYPIPQRVEAVTSKYIIFDSYYRYDKQCNNLERADLMNDDWDVLRGKYFMETLEDRKLRKEHDNDWNTQILMIITEQQKQALIALGVNFGPGVVRYAENSHNSTHR